MVWIVLMGLCMFDGSSRFLGLYKISIKGDTIAVITSMDNTITALDCSSSNCHISNANKVNM